MRLSRRAFGITLTTRAKHAIPLSDRPQAVMSTSSRLVFISSPFLRICNEKPDELR